MSDSTNQSPAIRSFQYDTNSVGDLRNSVNLFRGDVNLSQPLFSLPGRAPGDGLDIAVSLFYQSNVQTEINTWNRDAPTSVVGLGWSLPRTYIELQDGGSPTPGLWQYVYWDNGASNLLVREPTNPTLFAMPPDLAAGLNDGAAVPSAIVSAFRGKGLPLDASASVHGASPAWTMSDDVNQIVYRLAIADEGLLAADGGASFQLQSYRFWKILYYPRYERWSITDESGLVTSFGGLDGNGGTTGNAIEWAVAWADANGEAVWKGASSQVDGQTRYARAWNKRAMINRWGDVVAFGYNQTQDGGTLAGTTRTVGAGGQAYGQACYLTSIRDALGRTAWFNYAEKLWSDATPASPREYADPHNDDPGNASNLAWQDRYETLYLASIDVLGADGEAVTQFVFDYTPSAGGGGPVANVSRYADGSLRGDTFKRFLTGIRQLDAGGDGLPGTQFDYYFSDGEDGANPGGLKTVTQPKGAVATYQYTCQSLDICERRVTVTRPTGAVQDTATPSVWFGPDYAVCLWADDNNLALTTRTWIGSWRLWPGVDDQNVFQIFQSDTDEIDTNTVTVVAKSDFFAIAFQRHTADNETFFDIYAFRKSIGCPGQWEPADLDGAQTGTNAPTLSYELSSGLTNLIAGDRFLVIATSDGSQFDRLTWRWTTAAWTRDPQQGSGDATALAASAEYYAAVDRPSGAVAISYLDQTLNWQRVSLDGPSGWPGNFSEVSIGTGASIIAVSGLIESNANQVGYQVGIYQWGVGYDIALAVPFIEFDDKQGGAATETSPVPMVVENSLVAVAGHVIRFDGYSWSGWDSSLQPGNPRSGEAQRYAYGSDTAILVTSGAGVSTQATAISYDPTVSSGSPWVSDSVDGSAWSDESKWPSAAADQLVTVGPVLGIRNTQTSLAQLIASDSCVDMLTAAVQALNDALQPQTAYTSDQCQLLTQTLVNQDPNFVACNLAYPGPSRAVVLFNVRNGGLFNPDDVSNPPVVLLGEKIADPSDDDRPSLQPGVPTGGPMSVVTYPADQQDFGSTGTYYMYRYAGDSVTGNITHYAVTGVSIDDGYQDPSPTTFQLDTTRAQCDPTGRIVKYYQNTTYPGSATTSPVNGSTVTSFLQGSGDTSGQNYYNMLDGLLEQETGFDNDGNVVSRTVRDWQVFTQRASDPVDGSLPPLNLFGGFVVSPTRSDVLDGVAVTVATTVVPDGLPAPFHGQPVSKAKTQNGSTGTVETVTTSYRYGCEADPDFLVTNRLGEVVQTTTSWASVACPSRPLRASVSTYDWVASGAADGTMVLAEEADFDWLGQGDTAFPFGDYQAGDTPAGWNAKVRILARSPRGLAVEMADAAGTRHSTLFGSDTFPVARFANASLSQGQCAYWGFEPYETPVGFATAGTSVVADSVMGTSCLSMPSDPAATLTVTVTPANADQVYVLCYWYKTQTGFTPGDGTGWSVVVDADGEDGDPVVSAFQDTGGEWRYATVGVPLTAATGSLSVTATARNGSGTAVLVDSVSLVPIAGGMLARNYDPRYVLANATMDSRGAVSRVLHDSFQRVIGAVQDVNQVLQLGYDLLSRQGAADDGFDIASPNAKVSVHAAGGGYIESFRDGSAWAGRWDAGASAGNWSTRDGMLVHSGGTSDTLTWTGGGASAPTTFAAAFDIANREALTGPVGVTFGGGYVISFTPGTGYAFTAPGGGSVAAPLASPPTVAARWLLIVGQGAVIFVGDGQVLFSARLSVDATAGLSIQSGPNPIALANLAVVIDPRVAVAFSDAAGRLRQTHQLWSPASGTSDARIVEVIYDALDRRVATTKPAPASFGADETLPLLVYRPNFCDVAAFLSPDNTTGEMTGDVADYYRGQSDGQTARSDDGGYPFRAVRYEASPVGRQVEQSEPGAALAINPTVPVDQRATYRTDFGTGATPTSDLDDPTPPAYPVTRGIAPAGTQVSATRDPDGRILSSRIGDGETDDARTSAVLTVGDNGTSTLVFTLPNADFAGGERDGGGFAGSEILNALGQVVSASGPSTGTIDTIFDPAGRARFKRLPADAGGDAVIYRKYDPLGRVLEIGTVDQPWDPEMLEPAAADPAWPGAGVDHTVQRAFAYDGAGESPHDIGLLVSATTTNASPAAYPDAGVCTVQEQMAHDVRGRTVAVTTTISGPVSSTATVTYDYNNVNEVVRIGYPDGAPLQAAYYGYDDQGRVVAIGSSPDTTDDIAAYTYTVGGQVATQTRNAGQLVGTFDYTPASWIQARTEAVPGEPGPRVSMTTRYAPDGRPTGQTTTFAFDDTETVSTDYSYDSRRQLSSAIATGGAGGSETFTQIDPNGNILAVSQDGVAQAYELEAGTDRLVSVSLDGGDPTAVTAAPDGWLTSVNGLGIERDQTLGRAVNLSRNGLNVRLAYGLKSRRKLRQPSDGDPARVYVHGIGNQLLAEASGDAWKVYVPGATGLAAIAADQMYFPVIDKAETLLGVVDSANRLYARHQYRAFGAPLASTGPGAAAIGPRFMGHDWDPDLLVYDFGARLYDPALRRFLSPDPRRQFASPYVFVANDPISNIDPSGGISVWSEVGLAVVNAAIIVAGFALTVPSAGASDGAAAAVVGSEGAVAGTEVSASAAGGLAGQSASSSVEVGAGASASEGAGEAANGARAVRAGENAARNWSRYARMGAKAFLQGAGTNGATYQLFTSRSDFSLGDMLESMAVGGIGGVVGEAAGNALEWGASRALTGTRLGGIVAEAGMRPSAGFYLKLAATAVKEGSGSVVGQISENLIEGQDWKDGLGEAFALGAIEGVAKDRLGAAFKTKGGRAFAEGLEAGMKKNTGWIVVGISSVSIGYICWGGAEGFRL